MVPVENFSVRSELKIFHVCVCRHGDMGGMALPTMGSPSVVRKCSHSAVLLLSLVLCLARFFVCQYKNSEMTVLFLLLSL